jgi:hypothetical protein
MTHRSEKQESGFEAIPAKEKIGGIPRQPAASFSLHNGP